MVEQIKTNRILQYFIFRKAYVCEDGKIIDEKVICSSKCLKTLLCVFTNSIPRSELTDFYYKKTYKIPFGFREGQEHEIHNLNYDLPKNNKWVSWYV